MNDLKQWLGNKKNVRNLFREPKIVFSIVVLPLLALALYFSSVFWLHALWSIPKGVNFFFAKRTFSILLLFLVGSFVITLLLLAINKFKFSIQRSEFKLSIADLLLLLLPLTPVVQYMLNNRTKLPGSELVFMFFFFLFLASIYVFVIPMLLRILSAPRVLIFAGLAFSYTLTSMSSLSASMHWFTEGSLKIQLLFFAGVFLITWALSRLSDQRVLRLVIVLIFGMNSLMHLSPKAGEMVQASSPASMSEMPSLIGEQEPVRKPSIYLLVYDSYVGNETMLAYGIDNKAQEDLLKGEGFTMYPQTYSVENDTLDTMNRVLNATALDDGTGIATSGNGVAQNLLKDLGYKTYGVFPNDYFLTRHSSSYDVTLPSRRVTRNTLLKSTLMGEFQFQMGFDTMPKEQFVQTKQEILGSMSGSIFIYSHSNFPGHSQNSGACRPNETELYSQRLMNANEEMKHDIEIIVKNDPTGIIIVAGDHGPALTKNCYVLTANEYDASEISRLDIQDRIGTFLAIRWPTGDYSQYDDITVLQDVFPAVFAYMYADPSLLDAKVDSSTKNPKMLGQLAGVYVEKGIIHGGINDGESLFLTQP